MVGPALLEVSPEICCDKNPQLQSWTGGEVNVAGGTMRSEILNLDHEGESQRGVRIAYNHKEDGFVGLVVERGLRHL